MSAALSMESEWFCERLGVKLPRGYSTDGNARLILARNRLRKFRARADSLTDLWIFNVARIFRCAASSSDRITANWSVTHFHVDSRQFPCWQQLNKWPHGPYYGGNGIHPRWRSEIS
jgi:hypothetical protein